MSKKYITANCIDENCRLRLIYIEGQWYHVNPHEIEVDHDAIPQR